MVISIENDKTSATALRNTARGFKLIIAPDTLDYDEILE